MHSTLHSTLLGRWWVTFIAIAVTVLIGIALNTPSASAYSYVSKAIDDVSVTSTNTSVDGTADVTVTFTWPDVAWSTSDYIYIYSPYFYSYAGGNYTSDSTDISNATISSSQLTLSYSGSTYAYFYPKSALSNGSAVSITFEDVVNSSIEGTGNWYVSGYRYTNDSYFSANGSGSVVNGTVDLTVYVKDVGGVTGVSGAYISLSYYNSGNWSDYHYVSGTTNSSGQVQFAGMQGTSASPKTYSVYLYYSGDSATGDTPSNTTLTYSGTDSAPTYTFVAKNVTTYFKDSSNNGINNAYWYAYKTNSTNYTDDYVWRWGYTNTTGKISFAAQKDGNYTLYVQDPSSTSYTYYPYEFTVASGAESGLDSTIYVPSPEVTGTVKAGSSGASGVPMYIHNSNWSVYQYATTESDGTFELALNKNCSSCTVEISSWGLPSNYFAPESTTVSVTKGVANSAITIDLIAATKTISGTVTMNGDDVAKVAAGTPVSNAYGSCYQSSGNYNYASFTTSTSGTFSIMVTGGKWKCYLWPNTWPATWAYVDGEFNPSFNSDSTTETASYYLKVEPFNSHITGTISYPNGSTVGEYAVYIYSSGGKKDSTTKSVYAYDYTDSSGAFSLNTTAGTHDLFMYFYSSSGGNNYVAPSVEPITLEAGETHALGALTLVEKNSHLQGAVSVKSTGAGVSGINVYAWKSKGSYDWDSATTDSSGKFDLLVSPGDWTISIYMWNQTTDSGEKYIYAGGSLSATVEENETLTGQDFVLTIADSTANFIAQDSSGNAMEEEYGWASISEEGGGDYGWYSTGCYLTRGGCQTDITGGVAYNVNYYSYSNWGWYDEDEDTYSFSSVKVDGVAADSFTAAADETLDVVLVMAKNDATLEVSFEDKDGNPVEVNGEVYASNSTGGWAYKYISDESDATIKLSSGTWNVNYWTWDDWTSYDKKTEDKKVELVSGETTNVVFPVLENDATVSGVVNDPDGNPVTTPTFVKLSTNFGTNETETGEQYGLIERTMYTDSEGKFSAELPAGIYYLSASSPEYLDTEPIQVTADTEDSAVGLVLQFVSPDAMISGTVIDGVGFDINNARTLAIGDGVPNAFVTAFSNKGSARTAETDESGAYEIEAVRDQTWYIMGIFEAEGIVHYSSLTAIEVDEATEVANITLDKTITLPEPQSQQFDPSNAAVIQLENGMEMNMPALSVSADEAVDEVTVTVTPTYELAQEASSKPLSIGYEITAVEADGDPITELASDVTLTIPYEEADVETAEIEEEDLQVGFYDSTAADWSNVSSVVVDTEADEFTVTTGHLSQFAIVSGRSIASANDDDEDGGGSDGGNGDGNTDDDEAIDILSAPTGVAFSKRRAKTITVSWNAVAEAASYEVGVFNGKTGKKIKTASAANSKRAIRKLTSNTKYEFRVRSVGVSGTRSGWSAISTARTLPATPKALKVGGVSITGSVDASATLRWNKPRGKVNKYVVTVYNADGSVYDTIKTNKRTLTVTGLSRGTSYAFSVKARFNKKNTSAASARKKFNTPSGL